MADYSFALGMLKQEQEKRKMQQALQAMAMEAQLKQQMQQQDPSYQANQFKMIQALEQMRRQAQFQRGGDIAYGGAMPSAQEVSPLVPQNLQQRFMQRPTSPPGLANQYRQQIRQPFEQAGQTLVPGERGWQRTRMPGATDKTSSMKIQLQKLAQQEAYRQMGGSMMVGLSETKRKKYKELVNSLYQSYLKQFKLNETNNINIGNNEENVSNEETNIMDTNW